MTAEDENQPLKVLKKNKSKVTNTIDEAKNQKANPKAAALLQIWL